MRRRARRSPPSRSPISPLSRITSSSATGSSNTQINALCGAVEKDLEEQGGVKVLRREGYRDGTWVLLDYG